MPSYVISPVTPEDIPHLAAIQQAAFADDPMTHAALAAVSKTDYIAWCEHAFAHLDAPQGLRAELRCARDPSTGKIGGWARWLAPLRAGEEFTQPTERTPLPRGIDEEIWHAAFKEIVGHHDRLMGARARWTLIVLVVDPSFQRRGIGFILVSDGVARAHAQSLPVILSASPMGVHLYTSLGFETKDTPVLECAGFSMPVMASEPA